MLDREKGNLSTLAGLGYSPAGPVIELSKADEGITQRTREELVEKRQYIEFREGGISGYIWYNSLLEKWFGDVYVNAVYMETFVAADLNHLARSVLAIYGDGSFSATA